MPREEAGAERTEKYRMCSIEELGLRKLYEMSVLMLGIHAVTVSRMTPVW
jgi:hypothetical protein